ncbi:leucine-rich repeat serine/threonine-protein kinase 1-like isoform X2 [Dendronephthya gigantea]|nr:leucine-rich repeat serine/threonine-protein kinase 1-like isoform X2 [Dendronephthya gigantea]
MASLFFVHEGEMLHQASIHDVDDLLLSLLTSKGNGDANSRDNYGRSAVHTAAQHGSEKCLKILLDYGGNPNLVSSPPDHCSTPVHHAAVNGHISCIKLLVERGADLDIPNANGKRPVDLAIQEGHVNCVQYLHREAARRQMEQQRLLEEAIFTETANGRFHRVQDIIQKLGSHFNVEKQYNAGETLLLKACEKGSAEIVKLLLENGATGQCNQFTGISPLYAACVNNNVDVVKALLEKFPELVKQGTKVENNMPLHIVCGSGDVAITKLMVQTNDGSDPYPCIGLDINCQTTSGMTPLHNAATAGHCEIVKLLLKPNHHCTPPCKMTSTCDVNARSKVGRTPLHDAVTIGNLDVVEILLENNANPNCAARTDELGGFEYLSDEMADMVNSVNSNTITPLQQACFLKEIDTVKVLLRFGAKDVGNKCLHHAITNKDQEIAMLLLGKDVNPSEEYNLPQKFRDKRNDLAPVSIVWHNYALNHIEPEWLFEAPKSVLRPEISATLNHASLAATITNLDISKNRLESLPIEIFQLPSLKHLSASHNEISLLPMGKGQGNVGSTSSDDVFSESEPSIWYCPHLEEIDLQNNNLMSLPGCLFLLPGLRILNASKNDIGSLPFDIWNSPNLRIVLLSNNYIKGLSVLPNASGVYSTMNGRKRSSGGSVERERQIIPTTTPSSSEHRNSRGTDMKDAKPDVGRLQITSFRSWLGDGNLDTVSSDEDEELDNQAECPLEKLDLSFNQLDKFPVGLPCLAPKLSKLLLSNNNIATFPPIQEIPEHLSHLDLSANKLKLCLPNAEDKRCDRLCYSPIQKRRASKKRNRSRTSLSSPVSRMWCRHCKHKRLRHMKRLELDNNQLHEVRFLYLGRLLHKTQSMKNINREDETPGGAVKPTGNSRENSTGEICVFPNLISLTLNDNKLEYLTDELGKLTKLGSLDVGNNPLTKSPRLPPAIGMLGDLWDLNVKGLTLHDPPPNVLEKKTKAITGYLLSVLDKSEPYPSMKLMFVGVSNIGKSTLLTKLTNGYIPRGWLERREIKRTPSKARKTENVSTVGVDVAEWVYPSQAGSVFRNTKPSITFSTWDFGGQKEYYATHQLFLSHRALYLAIWKLTDGEEGVRNLLPWLLNIQARAPDSVVIIVGTFYDQLTTAQQKKNGFVDRMHKLISQLYVGRDLDGGVGVPRERGLPRVVRMVDVSCTTGHHINLLREMIYTTALEIKGPGGHSLLEEQLIPASYLAVKTAVSKIRQECCETNQTPVVRADVFRQKVELELESKGVKLRNDEELEQACQFLHDNGILLHYDDPSLSGLYFLDPQWLCDMMAHVVAIRDVNPFVQNGILRFSDLSQLFRSDRFPSKFIHEYVDLLNKFEVALPFITDHLLVPSLLPEQQIVSRNAVSPGISNMVARAMNMAAYTENRVLRRQYLMSYVPSGFWARLITRVINDKQLEAVVIECTKFIKDGETVDIEGREMTKIVRPEWSCWKTGLELSCFGVKLLRISQLQKTPFYGCPDENLTVQILINGEERDTSSSTVVEVIAPSVMIELEKFAVKTYTGVRVKSVSDRSIQSAGRFLALIIQHIDTLLQDWYPGLDTTNIYGDNLVSRLVPCPKCICRIISFGNAQSPRHQRRNESDQNGDEEYPSGASPSRSTFYVSTPENGDQSPRDTTSPSSDSGSSSGLGTDNSFVTVDPDDFSSESSPVPHNGNPDSDDSVHDSSGSEPEQSSAGSQTSGVPPSPRHGSSTGERLIATFEFEECVVVSHTADYMTCPVDGELPLEECAPDVVFADIAPKLSFEPSCVTRKKKLGQGTFGTVFAGEVKQDGKVMQVALKMPLDLETDENSTEEEKANAKAAQRKVEEVPQQMYTDAYRSIRQELSILIDLNHPHILQLKGFCLNPLSLILEFAPKKSLDKILADYKRAGSRLDPYVLQKCVVQCSAALKYLHKRHIIYRDLKSENILVWKFPGPFSPNQPTHEVIIKVADYGISRAASIAGAKGLGGTPGFMAPEIEKYSGRETYTDKVDSYSFGMFLYELITQSQPFSDLNAAQIKQLTVEGKRPQLTSKEKRAPVFALELMLGCWSPNPEDRPSSSQIYNISSCSEFPRLLDVLTFDEDLHLNRSVTTRSRDYAGHGADGQLSIGKELWLFHTKIKEGKQKETVDVLCYSNGRSNHLEEFVVSELVIRVACSVGNTVWLGTDSGYIYVYCAITYKPLCQGALVCDKYIMSMIHAPKCHCVLVALYNGNIMAFSDNVTSHNKFRESCDLTSPKDLSPLRTYVGSSIVHCLAVVGIPKGSQNEDGTAQLTYEVWCGRGKGRITVLNAETLQEKQQLAAEDCDLDNPILNNLTVTTLQTCQTYGGSINEVDALATSVWLAVYPGTCVFRYDAREKRVVNSVDCLQNRPSGEGSHQIYPSDRARRVTESQVLSLLVANRELYIGTSSGCYLVCNSLSLLVYSVIRCHKTLECLLPLTTTPVTWNIGTEETQKEHSRLVLTSGKGYRSICTGRGVNALSSNLLTPPEKRNGSVVLVWLADER